MLITQITSLNPISTYLSVSPDLLILILFLFNNVTKIHKDHSLLSSKIFKNSFCPLSDL